MLLGGMQALLASDSTTPQYLNSDTYNQLGLPFSEVVRVGNTMYLSGHVGNIYGKLELVPGGIEAETRQTVCPCSWWFFRFCSISSFSHFSISDLEIRGDCEGDDIRVVEENGKYYIEAQFGSMDAFASPGEYMKKKCNGISKNLRILKT